MYCKNCGAEIKDEANFCSKCGKKIYTGSSEHVEDKGFANKRNIIIFSILLIAILLIAIIFIKNNTNNDDIKSELPEKDRQETDAFMPKELESTIVEEQEKKPLKVSNLRITEIVPIESDDERCEIKYICNVNGSELEGSIIDYDYERLLNDKFAVDARAAFYTCDIDNDGDDEIVMYTYCLGNTVGEDVGELHIVKIVNSGLVEILNSIDGRWKKPNRLITGIEINNNQLFFYSGEKNSDRYKTILFEEKYELIYADGQWKNEIIWTDESITEFFENCNFINGNEYSGYVNREGIGEKGEIDVYAIPDAYIDYKFADFDNDSEDELLLVGHDDEQITLEIAEYVGQRVIITDRIEINGCTSERFIGDTCVFNYEKDGKIYIAVESKSTMTYLGDGTRREFDLITYDEGFNIICHFSLIGSDFDDMNEAQFYNDIKSSEINASWDKIIYEDYYIRDFIDEKISYITCINSWQISYGVFDEWENSESKRCRCSIITLSDFENMAYRAYMDFLRGRRNIYDYDGVEKNIDEILHKEVYGYITPSYWFIKNNNSDSVAMVFKFPDGAIDRYNVIYYDEKTQCLRSTGSFGRESQSASSLYDDTYVLWETLSACGCHIIEIMELDENYKFPSGDSEREFVGFVYSNIYGNHDEEIHRVYLGNYENITDKYEIYMDDTFSIGEHYLMDNYQINDINNRIPIKFIE